MMEDLADRRNVEAVLKMILGRFGIRLPETHYGTVFSFINKQIFEKGMSCSEYLKSLLSDREEYVRFVETITINESYFFRDGRHFSVLYNTILPKLFQEKQCIKIWSAAAASGEEALSAAAVCHSLLSRYPLKEYSVYASDINVSGLDKMKKARYNGSSLREDGARFHNLLDPFLEKQENGFSIKKELLKRVVICEHNLFSEDYSALPDDFDIVFLRNVFIYMPIENRRIILNKIVSRMREGGYLFLSSSEVPLVWHPLLRVIELEGTFFFRRVPAAENAFLSEDYKKMKKTAVPDTAVNSTAERIKVSETQQRFDRDKLFELINCRLFNPAFNDEGSREGIISEYFVLLIDAVNKSNWDEADKILSLIEKQIPGSEAVLFYRGLVGKQTGKKRESCSLFKKALEKVPSFWPARYELAMLQKEDDPEAGRRQFHLCKKHIAAYIAKDRYAYHFLLEGFNALYFMKICDFWEKKLRER